MKLNFAKPIKSVRIQDDYGIAANLSEPHGIGSSANIEQVKDSKTEKMSFNEARSTLQGVIDKLNELYDSIFAGQREEIARLSVEIARKILMQKVEDGNYEIESIVKEALKNAPTHEDLVVHLNPQDLAQCQKAQQEGATGPLAGIKFVADSNIGRAECLLETGKGIVKSLIDEHLERIGKALEKAG